MFFGLYTALIVIGAGVILLPSILVVMLRLVNNRQVQVVAEKSNSASGCTKATLGSVQSVACAICLEAVTPAPVGQQRAASSSAG